MGISLVLSRDPQQRARSEEVMSSDNPTPSPHDAKHKPVIAPPDAGSERRMEILEARVAHLEAELEGLQDAIHRQAVLRDERLDELDRRTEPHQIARALSQDARKRGV
jgi:uncharacterized coiled-coil protein SlyX